MNRAQFEAFADKALAFYKSMDGQLADAFGQPIHKRSPVYRIPTKWPLTRIDSALMVTLFYLFTISLLYVFITVMYDDDDARSKDKKKSSKKNLTVMEKMKKDGIVIFFRCCYTTLDKFYYVAGWFMKQ